MGGMTGIQYPAGARNFSLCHHIQTGLVVHPASYPVGDKGFFSQG